MSKQTKPASPVKPVAKSVSRPAPSLPTPAKGGVDADDLDMLSDADTNAIQEKIDSSILRELEGFPYQLAGIDLRPLSMSAVMRLHQVGNEIMQGKQVKDMTNPLFSAAEFLYMLAVENPLDEVTKAAFGDKDTWRLKVVEWAETLTPHDNLVGDVIDFINDTSSTRVKGRLPRQLTPTKGEAPEGNGSLHHGL